jgi:PEP-CTERM motif
MKKSRCVFLAFAAAVMATGAQATPITRAGFSASATSYDFTGLANGVTTAGNADLSVTNGYVTIAGDGAGLLNGPTYYDGGDTSQITLIWASGISAVGMNYMANNQATTLSLYGAANNLLETLTLPASANVAGCYFTCGFIGIDLGTSSVYKAIIDTPLNGTELYIDAIVYQRSNTVPEPSSLALGGLVLSGLVMARRRQR